MSKHWKPRRSGWAGRWGRQPWQVRSARPSAGVLTRFRWSELRLMLLGGLLVGVAVTRVGTGARLADGDSRSVAVTGPVRVIDGDTFDYGGMRIRIADIDTPEVDGRCAYESELAAQATARLDTLLSSGAIELHRAPGGRDEDRYGRKLRIVTRDGRSIGDALVAEGVARTWTGRREPWCGEA